MFDCKVEPVDCDADDYDCDAVDAIAHFSKRLGSLNNSDQERRALAQFVRDRGHLAPAFCDAICAAIAARPPQQRYLWYLLDHLVREAPEPYVQLFRRHLPQLEGHFPFLESPINLAHLLHKWRDVFHCPAVERCDVACQTTVEAKPLTPLDIEVKKMQLKLKQWQDAELRREEERLETASAWMLESHRRLCNALVKDATEYHGLVRWACACLERAFEFSGMDAERGHEEATEVAVRYQLMAQQEAERAQLQRLEAQRLRKLQALPAVHHPSEPPKLLAVSSNGGAEPRLLPAKRPPAIPETERRKRRRPLSSGKAPSGSQEGGPHPPAPPPDDDPQLQGDDAPHRPCTRNAQSRLDEARLKAEGLQFTAGLLQSTRDSEDLYFLYGQHFDRKVRKACAWHERSNTPEWDFSTAVSIGLRENSALVSASTVRHHPAHRFLELVTFATDKGHQQQGKGRVMAAVVEVYARLLGCDAIIVRAAKGMCDFWMNPSVGYTMFEPDLNGSPELAQYCATRCLVLADTLGMRRCLAAPGPDPILASMERLKWKAKMYLSLPGQPSRTIESTPPTPIPGAAAAPGTCRP